MLTVYTHLKPLTLIVGWLVNLNQTRPRVNSAISRFANRLLQGSQGVKGDAWGVPGGQAGRLDGLGGPRGLSGRLWGPGGAREGVRDVPEGQGGV